MVATRPTLSNQLSTDPPRARLVDDCVSLIDGEIASIRGLTGLVVRGTCALLRVFNGNAARDLMEFLLDAWLAALEPLHAAWLGPSGFVEHFTGRADVVAEALLSATDRRLAQSAKSAGAGLYGLLRRFVGKEQVKKAIPQFAKILDAHLPRLPTICLPANKDATTAVAPTNISVLIPYVENNTLVDITAQQFAAEGADVHLWAVQKVRPQVAKWTRGSGRIHKTEALNRLLAFCGDPDYVICADDDLGFPDDFLAKFLATVDDLGFDLAQPALTQDSDYSIRMVLAWEGTVARQVNTCEQMCFVMSRRMRQLATPFPDEFYMGWGLELLWEKTLLARAWKAGIIDSIPVRHTLRPLHSTYSKTRAQETLRENASSLGRAPRVIIRPLARYAANQVEPGPESTARMG